MSLDGGVNERLVSEPGITKALSQSSDKVVKVLEVERKMVNNVDMMLMVMEMGDMSVMKHIESRRQGLTLEDVRRCWSGMVSCVADIHKQGVIHLDVKPDNFVLFGDKIKLIDFGSCVQIPGNTQKCRFLIKDQ